MINFAGSTSSAHPRVHSVRMTLSALADESYACAPCKIDYAQTSVECAREVICGIPAAVREESTAIPAETLHERPSVGAWSVAEYVCHVRDVYLTYTIRLHRARTENLPVLEPMFNDLRARRFRYNESDMSATLDEIDAAVAGFGEEIASTSGREWERAVTRLPGEQRTARWLVRQAMHEGVHHVGDIRRIGRAVADG